MFRMRAPCPPSCQGCCWRGSSSLNPLGTGRVPARSRAGALEGAGRSAEPAAPKGSGCGGCLCAVPAVRLTPSGAHGGHREAQTLAGGPRTAPGPAPRGRPLTRGSKGSAAAPGPGAAPQRSPWQRRGRGTRAQGPAAPPRRQPGRDTPRVPPDLPPQRPGPEAPRDPRAPPAPARPPAPRPGAAGRRGQRGEKGRNIGQPLPATTAEPSPSETCSETHEFGSPKIKATPSHPSPLLQRHLPKSWHQGMARHLVLFFFSVSSLFFSSPLPFPFSFSFFYFRFTFLNFFFYLIFNWQFIRL